MRAALKLKIGGLAAGVSFRTVDCGDEADSEIEVIIELMTGGI
jgi:hypothetical protein